MAAFSYQQHHPFFLDSVNFFQANPIVKNMSSSFMDETNNNLTSFNCFSHLMYSPEVLLHDQHAQSLSTSLDQYNNKVSLSDNEPSLTQKQSTDSSIVVDKLESGEQVTQKVTCMEKKRKNNANGSSLTNCATSKDGREVKSKRQKKCNNVNGEVKEEEKKSKTEKKDQKKVNEEPPTGYIHVRARRGQATDSHSLAERVRREKISERMKILQRLVPGCDKVTGKALMLDEIINYVQSLQNQVEFLSMKLASVNPLFYDFGMDMDAYMIRPERLNSMVSPPPLPPVQQCSPTRLGAFAEQNTSTTTTTTTTTTTNFVSPNEHYNLIVGSSSVLLQGQRANEFSQDSGSLLWEIEEQRQKLLNPSGYTNNLCSFH